MEKNKFIAIILSFFLMLSGYAQQNSSLDSLYKEYKKTKQDTIRIKLLIEMGDVFLYNKPDSANFYYNDAKELIEKLLQSKGLIQNSKHSLNEYYAICYQNIGIAYYIQSNYEEAYKFFNNSLNIYTDLNDQQEISNCYNNIGNVYDGWGDFNKAIEYFQKALYINEKSGNQKNLAYGLSNIGISYCWLGIYDKSIKCFLRALRINEKIGDKKGISSCYNGLGIVHFSQNSYEKALEYYLKSVKLYEELGDREGTSDTYSNIGLIYYNLSMFEKANEYYLMSLKIDKELGDVEGISDCYQNLGNIHSDQGRFSVALDYYMKSLKIKEELNDNNGLSLLYSGLASIYYALADLNRNNSDLKNNYLRKAVEYGNRAMYYANITNSLSLKNEAAIYLYKAYKSLGNKNKALEYTEMRLELRDSLFKEEKTKALAEMEIRYQSEKKQLEIDKLGKQKELDAQTIKTQLAENKKQRILTFSFISGFLIILVFSVLLFRLFLQKKRANVLLATQNTEILQQKEEISTQRDEIQAQRDEIEAQRDLVTEQKEQIEKIHKEVTDSINYAKRIQEAVLPVSKTARYILGEYFILFKPKDIVSGDFYWTTKINKWLIIAVADCTGHGVPGAFMSMLGISFLNEIVRKQEINKANLILNQLREEVINALQQKGHHGEQKDGMDISLFVINTETNQCQWAGANNPLYVITRSETSKQLLSKEAKAVVKMDSLLVNKDDAELFEIKGDKMPIAIYPEMKDFTNHEFILDKGDLVYLFTDGYADQFGGPKGRKYLYKQFKDKLIEISQKSMQEHEEILEQTIENWKRGYNKEYEQIDDITVLGICI